MSDGNTLPTDSNERKDIPLARGCLDYFPAALAEVARLSRHGNEKHNPGEPLHHAREKSTDHADCILRHMTERGTLDTDGFLHDVKIAWRSLANLQEVLEARGAPLARGAKLGPAPTFRKGDRVRLVEDYGSTPRGTSAKVTEDYLPGDEWLRVEFPLWVKACSGGYFPRMFEIIA